MPRTTADYPNIFMQRVTVNDEVIVLAVLVLANSAFEQRSILQPGETEPHVVAHCLESVGAYSAVTRSRIEFGSTRIIGNLEAAPMISCNTVVEQLRLLRQLRDVACCSSLLS